MMIAEMVKTKVRVIVECPSGVVQCPQGYDVEASRDKFMSLLYDQLRAFLAQVYKAYDFEINLYGKSFQQGENAVVKISGCDELAWNISKDCVMIINMLKGKTTEWSVIRSR